MDNNVQLNFKFKEIIDIWKEFCNSHTYLYELTCEEYKYMLSSELESLEKVVDRKKDLIDCINKLEENRQEIIKEIELCSNIEINNATDLLEVIIKNKNDLAAKELEGYNNLLLEIIEKIQDQNKTNQIYLNRAIISLQELKESFQGKKSYKTYNYKGTTAVGANS